MNGIEIVGFEEKPVAVSHINAGVYVLEFSAIKVLEGHGHCDMPTLFQLIQNEGGRTLAFPMHEHWLDVGRPDDFEKAQEIKKSLI